MKKSIKIVLAGLLAVPMLAIGAVAIAPAPQTAFAACDGTLDVQSGVDCAQGSSKTTCLFTSSTCASGIFTSIVNILLFIIGAIAVIMLIFGGIRYTISGGDSSAITAAKNTILYAIVGLIVAVLAYAIVNFVLGVFIKA